MLLMRRINILRTFGISALLFLLAASASFAATTCEINGCDITITINISFQGATPGYMAAAEKEIEDVWNGPNGFRTTGDCKCKVTFKANTMAAADCKNNPPAGYHCIVVTDYNNDPPRNQTNWTGAQFYIGYMYGIASGNGGNSQMGWWSSIMSRPVDPANPAAGNYKDFSHEAGHMLGLEDCDGGLMCRTAGANSDPTQDNIDEAASEICGPDPCPGKCCCGNGQKDALEQCDPKATPSGCPGGQSCCAVCCGCYGLMCVAANGEYLDEASCSATCGAGSKCYKNYKTGCWNCVKQTVVVHKTCYDSANIRGNDGCDHVARSVVDDAADLYRKGFAFLPVMGGMFSNERMNIDILGDGKGYVITVNGEVMDAGTGQLDDPTMSIFTDSETVSYLAGEKMTPQQAISSGRVRIEGNGLFDGMRIGLYHLMFDIYGVFSPPGEFAAPEPGPEYPEEYYAAMDEAFAAEPADEEEHGHHIENLPDGGYIGSGVFPSE